MTTQSEVIDDPKYLPILNYGFVGLIDTMGSDAAIVQAARCSYGAGTKTVSEDRGLIRYLMRNAHTSPLEMAECKFHLKMPIFVARQLIRHRTASLNEYSGRYSIMSDEFYVPDAQNIQPQSADNKQGRAGEVDDVSKNGVLWLMSAAYDNTYDTYRSLLGQRDDLEDHYDPYNEEAPLLSDEFPGVAREMARMVLPVANYTEMYWKCDLNNLFKFLRLRQDHHAQYEIRVLANAMYDLIQPLFPFACEAYVDYMRDAVTMSRMEMDLLRELIQSAMTRDDLTELATRHGLSKREAKEFYARMAPGQ